MEIKSNENENNKDLKNNDLNNVKETKELVADLPVNTKKSNNHKKQKKTAAKVKKKIRKKIVNGKAYIIATFNNTLIYITDLDGNTLGWSTSGSKGFKGSKKSTPYAAQVAAQHAAQLVKDGYDMSCIDIIVKGPGPGREAAARSLSTYFKVYSISDATGIPHNGCRPSKERRV